MKRLILLILTVTLAACGTTPTPTVYSQAIFTLERTPCFGFCPTYKITVYGDGRVEYDGQQNVDVVGKQTTTLTPEQLNDLIAAFEKTDYFKLSDNYTALVTDIPSTITSVTLNGQTKTIVDYGGCDFDFQDQPAPPQSLCDFEDKIDEVTNSAQWVGQP